MINVDKRRNMFFRFSIFFILFIFSILCYFSDYFHFFYHFLFFLFCSMKFFGGKDAPLRRDTLKDYETLVQIRSSEEFPPWQSLFQYVLAALIYGVYRTWRLNRKHKSLQKFDIQKSQRSQPAYNLTRTNKDCFKMIWEYLCILSLVQYSSLREPPSRSTSRSRSRRCASCQQREENV